MFIPSSTYHKEEASIKPTKAHYPSNPKPSFNPKREVRKETLKPRDFVAVRVIWMSFAFDERELRRGALSMLETYIMMSSLICHLVLILVFHLARTLVLWFTLFHVLCLSSLMDLTISHMVLVHERTTSRLDALVMAHVLVVVNVSCAGLVFLLEGPTHIFSRDTWMVHVFPIVVHIPLGQVVRCKGL
jgi:hypothetical protein